MSTKVPEYSLDILFSLLISVFVFIVKVIDKPIIKDAVIIILFISDLLSNFV